MDIDQEYKDLVHTDATALLRPKTGLKDMFIDLEPGRGDAPVAKEGFTIPIRATQPDVNPDEILAGARRRHARLPASCWSTAPAAASRAAAATCATCSRASSRPTATSRASTARSRRGARSCADLITSLRVLNEELADARRRPRRARRLLGRGVPRVRSEERATSRATVRELPSTLQQTTDTLGRVETFAELLGPATEKLRPAARALDPANEAVRPFAREADAGAARRASGRSCARRGRWCATCARPPSGLADGRAGPHAGRSCALNHFFNMLGYNPNGREGPARPARQEGYLFWLAWLNALGDPAVLELRRQRHAAPGHLAAPCATLAQVAAGAARARVHRGADAAADRLEACDGGDRRRQLPDLPDVPRPDRSGKKSKG